MTFEKLVNRHYGSGGLRGRIREALASTGKNLNLLTIADLAPVDGFHTRGRKATAELAAMADLKPADQVLDVGCGLGGAARFLADKFCCQVTGVDLTAEYITTGQELNAWVGLEDQVTLQQGNVLDLPFDDASFDVAWTEHVQMNIPDKMRFYAEISRVLRPGGRLVFHDLYQGQGGPPFYPVPWAEDESISCLVTEAEGRGQLEQQGLAIARWHDRSRESLEFFQQSAAKIAERGFPPLGIHLLMGSNAPEKVRNLTRNLAEDRVTVVMGMARKPE